MTIHVLKKLLVQIFHSENHNIQGDTSTDPTRWCMPPEGVLEHSKDPVNWCTNLLARKVYVAARDGFAIGMRCVDGRGRHELLHVFLEDRSGLLVTRQSDTRDATAAGQAPDCTFGNALDGIHPTAINPSSAFSSLDR